VLLLFPLFVITAQEPEYSPDIQRIYDRGKLIVAVYKNDIAPLFYTDKQGRLVGHEIYLAKTIAAALGVGIVFNRQASSFDEVVSLVVAGKADLGISLVSRTMNRVRRARFSNPYLVIHPVLLVNRVFFSGVDKSNILESLKGRSFNISEKKGTAYVDMADALFPKARVNERTDWDEVIQDVVEGTADAALRDEIGVTNFVHNNPESGISIQLNPLEHIDDNIGVVLAPDSVQLEHWLNVFLEQNGYPIDSKELFERFGEK
jgi:ABC-type amino acid transport substrate-binding protein